MQRAEQANKLLGTGGEQAAMPSAPAPNTTSELEQQELNLALCCRTWWKQNMLACLPGSFKDSEVLLYAPAAGSY